MARPRKIRRSFSRKPFKLMFTFFSKPEANRTATEIRKEGFLSRVTTHRVTNVYRVWKGPKRTE